MNERPSSKVVGGPVAWRAVRDRGTTRPKRPARTHKHTRSKKPIRGGRRRRYAGAAATRQNVFKSSNGTAAANERQRYLLLLMLYDTVYPYTIFLSSFLAYRLSAYEYRCGRTTEWNRPNRVCSMRSIIYPGFVDDPPPPINNR